MGQVRMARIHIAGISSLLTNTQVYNLLLLVICHLAWAAPQTGGSGSGGGGGGAGSGSNGGGSGAGSGSGSGGSGAVSGTGMPGMMTTPDAVVSLFPIIMAGASFAMVGWC